MMKDVGQLFVYARSDGIANSQLPVDVRGNDIHEAVYIDLFCGF